MAIDWKKAKRLVGKNDYGDYWDNMGGKKVKNKPVRISEAVKRDLMKIKQQKELKSVDAVIKRLLKKEAGL